MVSNLSLVNGQRVQKGQFLGKLSSPDISNELLLTGKRIKLLQLRLRRIAADDRDRALRNVLKEQLSAEIETMHGVEKRLAELTLRAPVSGIISNVDWRMQAGDWIGMNQAIAMVRSHRQMVLNGLVSEQDLNRLRAGSSGLFVPDNPELPSFKVTITDLGVVNSLALTHEALADVYGGTVSTRLSQGDEGGGKLLPRGSWYRVRLASNENLPVIHTSQMSRGIAVMSGKRESYAYKTARQIIAVLVREFGI